MGLVATIEFEGIANGTKTMNRQLRYCCTSCPGPGSPYGRGPACLSWPSFPALSFRRHLDIRQITPNAKRPIVCKPRFRVRPMRSQYVIPLHYIPSMAWM
jgi:hypothetical protein